MAQISKRRLGGYLGIWLFSSLICCGIEVRGAIYHVAASSGYDSGSRFFPGDRIYFDQSSDSGIPLTHSPILRAKNFNSSLAGSTEWNASVGFGYSHLSTFSQVVFQNGTYADPPLYTFSGAQAVFGLNNLIINTRDGSGVGSLVNGVLNFQISQNVINKLG